jgi:hypothetical protein
MTKTTARDSIANIASTKEAIPPQIMRFILQSQAREILPNERVADCLRKIIPLATEIQVHKGKAKKVAYYKNLVVCGRIWHCPVCAAKITEERRKELHTAVYGWLGSVALVTYTARHNSRDKLSPLLNALGASFRGFKAGRAFQEIREHYGWIGSVRSLEVTHGENGWHPHIHEAVFFTNVLSGENFGRMEYQIKKMWADSLSRNGLNADHDHGLRIQEGWQDVGDYVSKLGEEIVHSSWTLSHEITKQPVKKGNKHGRTPMQLLLDAWEGDIPARYIWREYANVFKGKHQLVWSRGLRQILGMEKEKTDEEIAETIEDETEIIATLTPLQWKGILRAGVVGDLLYKAANDDEGTFSLWLADILDRWTQA